MAATTAPEFVSIAAYLRTPYEPGADYVDGEIEERPMGQDDHSAWQQAITVWFHRHREEWRIRVRPELHIRVAPTRFRIPDVTVLDRRLPKEPVVTHPPLAVFEVLSPDDVMHRMMRKLNDYAAMGIPQIWVVDPDGPRYYRFREGSLVAADTFGEPGDAMNFPLSAIAALVD